MRDAALIFIGALLMTAIFPAGCASTERDATDPSGGRSGLGLFIDHGTGCHYLSAGPIGGITPRLRADGSHICTGKDAARATREGE